MDKIPLHQDFVIVLIQEMEKTKKVEKLVMGPNPEKTEAKRVRFAHNSSIGKMLRKNEFLRHMTQLDRQSTGHYELFTITFNGKDWEILYIKEKE